MYTVLMSKTVLFQATQSIISTLFSSIWPVDRTLSGATTVAQSGIGNDGNKGVLHITGPSPSGSYPSVEKQLVYFTTPDWLGKTALEVRL